MTSAVPATGGISIHEHELGSWTYAAPQCESDQKWPLSHRGSPNGVTAQEYVGLCDERAHKDHPQSGSGGRRSYRNIVTPLPKVCVSTSLNGTFASDGRSIEVPRPISIGWT